MFTPSRQQPGPGWSPPPPPRTPLDPALMDRETLEDDFCLGQERYESLYGAYQELAVLTDALPVRAPVRPWSCPCIFGR